MRTATPDLGTERSHPEPVAVIPHPGLADLDDLDDGGLPWVLLDEDLQTGEGVPFVLARGSRHAAGFDLAAAWRDWEVPALGEATIGTGVAVAIPEGWVGLLALRSGIGVRDGALCHIGQIDSDYRGEILCQVHNPRATALRIPRGRRFAQLTLLPHGADRFPPRRVRSLGTTERGAGGFGSTGS